MLNWMKRLLPKTINARFDIAQTNADNRKHWANADSLSARASMSPAVRRVIRIRSRYESENNSWYSGVLRTATNHIVGCGPRLQVLTDNPEANTRLERAFGNWCRKIQLADKLRTAVEAYWRDGEVFFMRSERPRNYPMTLDLRTFETEQVASPMMGSILSDPFVDDGIRFDQATNEIEYHVFDRHPGGINPVSTLSGQWYPSREVLHLFRAERPGQVRGLPRATPALPLLPVMRRQQMAVLFSAETAANFALYLKSNSPAIDPTASPADFAEIEMARNMLTTLPSGWDIGQVEPKQPGPNYKEFQDHTLKSFARCTNMPYPLAAGTAQDSNFSSFKGDMRNVWRPEVLSEQDRIETSIIEPIFAWFLEAAIYVPGLLDGLPQLSEINHRWHWPPLPDLDPVDTANAASIKLGSGQSTLTQIHADAGQDWETEATRAATDFGVDVATYKAALFAKTFASPGAGQSAVGAMPNATPVATAGAFTGTKRRDFTNNQKATAEVLSAMIAGTSEVLTKASLLRLGWDDAAAQSLIDDARDGAITSPNLDPAASGSAVPV